MLGGWMAGGCGPGDPPEEPVRVVHAEIGRPLPGLGQAEQAAFETGAALFSRQYTQEEGLGPRFNENSCDACHTFPVDGGSGETSVRKVTRTLPDGGCDLLEPHGGTNLRIQVTARAAALGARPERDRSFGTHTAVFTIPFTFGLGLVEAVPLEALEARADPDDADGDGISGRLGRDPAGRPARFGRKADVATLEDFVDSAFRMEMGLTTPLVPDEARAGIPPFAPEGADPVPEPEVPPEELEAVLAFLRFLAPPSPAERSDPLVEEGEELFGDLGCAGCHVPVLTTGPSASPALDRVGVALYSDLLLHDMGPELEGTCAAGASTTEYRTEPLMGLRYREAYLHDGRAKRVMDAVLAHGGEAAAARNRFAALDRLRQEALLRFLGTL
jgi:CxxC motif-containing protein (DUF1111 family)